MTISIVNGYVCTSSCDVAKAKKGQDPHPATHAAESDGRDRADGRGDLSDGRGPAVVFGGSLGQVFSADGVKPADTGTDATSGRRKNSRSTCWPEFSIAKDRPRS